MEKIAVSFVGFCFKAALCGGVGYVLGGLTTDSISEEDLKVEKDLIRMNYNLDRSLNRVEDIEKTILETEMRRSKRLLSDPDFTLCQNLEAFLSVQCTLPSSDLCS